MISFAGAEPLVGVLFLVFSNQEKKQAAPYDDAAVGGENLYSCAIIIRPRVVVHEIFGWNAEVPEHSSAESSAGISEIRCPHKSPISCRLC